MIRERYRLSEVAQGKESRDFRSSVLRPTPRAIESTGLDCSPRTEQVGASGVESRPSIDYRYTVNG